MWRDWKAYVALIVAALESHADIEDKILFAALGNHLPANSGPLAVMRWEHDEIRSTLNRILGQSDADQIRRDILQFLEIVHAHFAKEEQVLFPLVEQLGPHDLAERLSQDYKTVRGLSAP